MRSEFTRRFDFSDLFNLEMANNHQGSVEHGLNIIKECGAIVRKHGVRAVMKFQFRDLDTFVHPAHRTKSDNKHIGRFLSTKLEKDQFRTLAEAVKKEGMYTMATPFDETSVDLLAELNIDILKIASCSAKDWPLLEKAVTAGKPMILSTGGMTMAEIGRLVSFLEHRHAHFALMHCVSIYPTPDDKLQLGVIEELRTRYPHIIIGFSTHEEPENMDAVKIAYALGARIFERHVGIPTDTIKLNAYSSTPEQLDRWIGACKRTQTMIGTGKLHEPAEQADLESLQRGVFAARDIAVGETISRADVYFAMPLQKGQLTSGRFRDGLVAKEQYVIDAALPDAIRPYALGGKEIIYEAIREMKLLLTKAKVPLNTEFELELSHHYGVENFRDVGAAIIDCINREYCKKLIIQLPGQFHPFHHHTKKEEAFQVLAGVLEIEMDGHRKTLHPGDVAVVQRGVRHAFWTDTGVIFEEISTTHHHDDSFYEDPKINQLERSARKTRLSNWGAFQLD